MTHPSRPNHKKRPHDYESWRRRKLAKRRYLTNTTSPSTPEQKWRVRRRLYERQDGKCAICKRPIRMRKGNVHIDHKTPIAIYMVFEWESPSSLDEIQIVHPKCHERKSRRDRDLIREAKEIKKAYDDLAQTRVSNHDLVV